MTTQEKIKMLTGATAAVLFNGNDRFLRFETLTAEQADEMITSENYDMGVSCDGYLWIGQRAYFGSRWVFADKSLAVIA